MSKLKINEIKKLLQEENIAEEFLEELKQDNRAGVKKLLANFYNKKKEEERLKNEYAEKLVYENKLYNDGYEFVCGVDEVGRGPLAGPVVAACVILKKDSYFAGLNDSKKLSKNKREQLFQKIVKEALSYAVVSVDNREIEKHNIYNATKIAMLKAIKKLKIKPDFILIDAMPLDTKEIKNLSIIKGDTKSISIAAASVIAKVYRDKYMCEMAKIYPNYDFENNAGYGTKKHLEALEKYGITPIHRRDFEPIKTMIKNKK